METILGDKLWYNSNLAKKEDRIGVFIVCLHINPGSILEISICYILQGCNVNAISQLRYIKLSPETSVPQNLNWNFLNKFVNLNSVGIKSINFPVSTDFSCQKAFRRKHCQLGSLLLIIATTCSVDSNILIKPRGT